MKSPLKGAEKNALASPEKLVESFIADYFEWNNAANTRFEDGDFVEAATLSEREYAEIVATYCRPGHQSQSIACSSESNHALSFEKIASVDTSSERSVVRTQRSSGPEAIYEYHMVFINGRWFLESILYVDEDGKKHESL